MDKVQFSKEDYEDVLRKWEAIAKQIDQAYFATFQPCRFCDIVFSKADEVDSEGILDDCVLCPEKEACDYLLKKLQRALGQSREWVRGILNHLQRQIDSIL